MNGKVPPIEEEPVNEDSNLSCLQLTTVGKTKALLQKNFLRMWRNVGYVLYENYIDIHPNFFCSFL